MQENITTLESDKVKFKVTATIKSTMPDNMVFVKGGTFQMGSNESANEKPIHSVTISDFYIGKYEVTQKEWREIMGTNPSRFKDCDNCPVEEVSWNDVQEYIKKLNAKTGKNHRLPTEAEWEYAARGGNQSKGYKYSGSNTISSVAWYYYSTADSKTHPVGQKSSNELGIYDMSGNVSEWCSDWYSFSHYASSTSRNPSGPSSGSARVVRGGSWFNSASYCRVANRHPRSPGHRYDLIGFRLVLQ
jgi:formylglycine-generating enzyme required for sulfatase activity